jgi:hypothetical protein
VNTGPLPCCQAVPVQMPGAMPEAGIQVEKFIGKN